MLQQLTRSLCVMDAGLVFATDTAQTAAITAMTYAHLPPSVIVSAPSTANTTYLVTLTAKLGGSNNAVCAMSFDVLSNPGGAVVKDITNLIVMDPTSLTAAVTAATQASASYLVTVSGHTSYNFRAAYRMTQGTNCVFSNRNIIVVRAT
jgi:hypothetical protein